MKTKNFLSQSGGKPDVTRRQNRNSIGSIVSRFSLVSLICVLMLTIGVGNAWGDTYTITFATGSSDGTKASTSTAASTCTTAATYVTGNLVTATNTYYSGSSGLKLGTKNGAGDIKINLSTTGQVVPTKVSVYAKYYSSSNKRNVQLVTNLGSTTATTTTGSFTEYSHTYSGSTKLSYIEIKSSGYIWVEKVVVTYTAAAPTYTLKVSNGLGGYTTYSSKVKSDLTQETAEGGNSCASGLQGYYSGWRVGALETPAGSPGTTYNHATAGDMPASGNTLYAVYYSSGEGGYLTNTLCDVACSSTPTMSFANATVNKELTGAGSHTQSVTISGKGPGQTVAYSSSNTSIGTVNSSGVVSLTGTVGSTTITASVERDGTYCANSATYTINVSRPKYTVTWSVNGNTSTISPTTNVTHGSTTTAPTASATGDCAGLVFRGWTTSTISGTQVSAPDPLFTGTTPAITNNVTFYAVFAEVDN